MTVLFRNGSIIDGSGSKAYKLDILLNGDRIVDIGLFPDTVADKVIDCTGLTIMPGFIDVHNHNDFLYDYPNAERYFTPFVKQGITTQVVGNCGFSAYGVDDLSPYKSKAGGKLFYASNPTGFERFVELAKDRLYLNFVPLVGHSTTRSSIVGFEPLHFTPDQIAIQCKLLADAMENGAFGGSIGLMFEPGIFAQKDELYAYAREIARHNGILSIHARACSRFAMGYPLLSKPHIELALDEIADIMDKTGVRVQYSHLIFTGKNTWSCCDTMLARFHELNARGHDIAYDMFAFTYGSSVITIPMSARFIAMSNAERKKPHNLFIQGINNNILKKFIGLEYSDLIIAYISPLHRYYEGRTISECARDEGRTDFQMYMKLVELSDAQGRIYLNCCYSEEIILKLMRDDLSLFMTDAWVEEGYQNGNAYQAFPYFLRRAIDHGIPIESIIRKMTGLAAERFGISKRGYIKKGYLADINVLDLNNIAVDPKRPDFTPQGIKHVFINGVHVIEDGTYKPYTAGKVILKPT